MHQNSQISVFVEEMRVHVRIGLHEHERGQAQPVQVNMELFTDIGYLSDPAKNKFIDYDRIYNTVQSWVEREHVELIETYLKELIDLGFSFENVTALRARISKPDIFKNAKAPGVEVFVKREDYC